MTMTFEERVAFHVAAGFAVVFVVSEEDAAPVKCRMIDLGRADRPFTGYGKTVEGALRAVETDTGFYDASKALA